MKYSLNRNRSKRFLNRGTLNLNIKKSFILILAGLVVLVFMTGCSKSKSPEKASNEIKTKNEIEQINNKMEELLKTVELVEKAVEDMQNKKAAAENTPTAEPIVTPEPTKYDIDTAVNNFLEVSTVKNYDVETLKNLVKLVLFGPSELTENEFKEVIGFLNDYSELIHMGDEQADGTFIREVANLGMIFDQNTADGKHLYQAFDILIQMANGNSENVASLVDEAMLHYEDPNQGVSEIAEALAWFPILDALSRAEVLVNAEMTAGDVVVSTTRHPEGISLLQQQKTLSELIGTHVPGMMADCASVNTK